MKNRRACRHPGTATGCRPPRIKGGPDLLDSPEVWVGLLEAAPDAIIVVSADGRMAIVNAQTEKMFGHPRAELLGQPVELLIPDRFRAAHRAHRARYDAEPGVRPMGVGPRIVGRRNDGSEFPADIALSPLETRYGRLTIAIVRDITERQRSEERLRYLGTHDPLTGLYNRAYLEEEVARLERSRRFPVSVVMLDVDGLKAANDEGGHFAGDELLRRTAAVLADAFRSEDIRARVGGDEFVVLLPSTDAPTARDVLERLREILRARNATRRGRRLSLSMGVATARRGASLTAALREADRQMYLEKLPRAASL